MSRPIVASDLMNPAVLTVSPELTVQALAGFLVENDITGAPVCEDGRLVGVVSLVDVADAAAAPLDPWRPGYLRGHEQSSGVPAVEVSDPNLCVRDIMTRQIQAVEDDTPVSKIARLMLDHHLHRVLVTRDEELVGIISTSDMLGLLVEDDD